jgi:hypothetical protein
VLHVLCCLATKVDWKFDGQENFGYGGKQNNLICSTAANWDVLMSSTLCSLCCFFFFFFPWFFVDERVTTERFLFGFVIS